MTLRVSDWQSESDLDSVRNSCDVFAFCFAFFCQFSTRTRQGGVIIGCCVCVVSVLLYFFVLWSKREHQPPWCWLVTGATNWLMSPGLGSPITITQHGLPLSPKTSPTIALCVKGGPWIKRCKKLAKVNLGFSPKKITNSYLLLFLSSLSHIFHRKKNGWLQCQKFDKNYKKCKKRGEDASFSNNLL